MTSCVDPGEVLDQKPVIDIKPEIRSLESPAEQALHHSTLLGQLPPDPLKSPANQFYLPDMYGMRDPLAGVHAPCHPTYNPPHHISPVMVRPSTVVPHLPYQDLPCHFLFPRIQVLCVN